MTDPDFQALSETSMWSSRWWSEAWSILRNEEPNETRREAIWDAVVKLSPFMRPNGAVVSILQALNS